MLKKINKAQSILIIAFLIVCFNIIRLWVRNEVNPEDLTSLITLQLILILAFYIFRTRKV